MEYTVRIRGGGSGVSEVVEVPEHLEDLLMDDPEQFDIEMAKINASRVDKWELK